MTPGHRSTTLLLALLLVGCARTSNRGATGGPARYLYVWAGTGNDTASGLDMMTVLDADPAHPKEVASFPTSITFYPHWISADPGSDRWSSPIRATGRRW